MCRCRRASPPVYHSRTRWLRDDHPAKDWREIVIFSSRPPPMILLISAEGDGEAYVRYLTTAGLRVSSASGIPTSEIVDRTLATMPDMIVLDYDCDGETIARLKADRRTAPIPVIVLADFPVPPGRPESSDSGASTPLDRSTLRSYANARACSTTDSDRRTTRHPPSSVRRLHRRGWFPGGTRPEPRTGRRESHVPRSRHCSD